MTQDTFVKMAMDLIYAVDNDGFPLPAHTKVARLQILTDEYKATQGAKK